MMNGNPFNVLYGMIPDSLIQRGDSFHRIVGDFTDEGTKAMSYFILGIRGSGKTVLLRSVAKELKGKKDWIVIDLNPQGDLISPLAEALFAAGKEHHLPFDWSMDLSLPYVTFHVKKDATVLSPEMAAKRLLAFYKEKGKRILLTIDEVNSTEKMKYFANFYQSLLGEGDPVFLLMTGLMENIDALMNSKAASFLSRSPRVLLDPLDLASVSLGYQKELKASPAEAAELAKLTKGYAFAYQVVGKICYEEKTNALTPIILQKIDRYLAENGYSVIWKNMTDREKALCVAVAESPSSEVSTIRERAGISLKNFNNYRAQMIQKGYLLADGYGKISFALPRFREYIEQVRYLM